jgi:hypothetical protein
MSDAAAGAPAASRGCSGRRPPGIRDGCIDMTAVAATPTPDMMT